MEEEGEEEEIALPSGCLFYREEERAFPLPLPLRVEGILPVRERGGYGLALWLPMQEEERVLLSGFLFWKALPPACLFPLRGEGTLLIL